MDKMELRIARTLGASSYLIYSFIKHHPGANRRDIELETGLSENCVGKTLLKLRDTNIVEVEKRKGDFYVYRESKDTTKWNIH